MRRERPVRRRSSGKAVRPEVGQGRAGGGGQQMTPMTLRRQNSQRRAGVEERAQT